MLLRTALVVLGVIANGTAYAQQPAKVDSKGQRANIKIDQVVAGHLTELNGRYKLRATEVTWELGGYIGPHHHVGPGIRCVTSGELTYITDKTNIYRPGDCFFESGDVNHTARNATDKPVVLMNFEIVPAAHTGGTAIPVRR
jgi:quercetin dioxygenase-like cupin family protein